MTQLPISNKPPGFAIKISLWQRFKWWLGIGIYKIQRHQTIDFGYSGLKKETLDKLHNMFVDKLHQEVMPPMKIRKDK